MPPLHFPPPVLTGFLTGFFRNLKGPRTLQNKASRAFYFSLLRSYAFLKGTPRTFFSDPRITPFSPFRPFDAFRQLRGPPSADAVADHSIFILADFYPGQFYPG